MHETAMPGVRPLTVATGKTLEHFGAGEGRGGNVHDAVNGVVKKQRVKIELAIPVNGYIRML